MKKKLLCVFYIILIVAWFKTEYEEPAVFTQKVTRRALPKEKHFEFPNDYSETHNMLSGLFRDSTSSFTGNNFPVLALPPFTLTTGGGSPELLNLITESAYSHLRSDGKVRVVRRDYSPGSKSRIKAKYILIGRVGTIGDQIRVTVRVQDINTSEILDVFDSYIDRTKVSKYFGG